MTWACIGPWALAAVRWVRLRQLCAHQWIEKFGKQLLAEGVHPALGEHQVPRLPRKSHPQLRRPSDTTPSLQTERFVRDFLQNSTVKCQVSKNERFVRDFSKSHTSKSPERAFRTRRPPKVKRPSLQNERFVRDFLQKSSVKVAKSNETPIV